MSINNSSGKFPDIIGYITEAERVALQKCIIETSGVEGDALEIGSLNGLSALLITSVLASNKTLICIEKGQVETLAENLIKHGHGDQVAIKNENFNKVELKPDVKLSFSFVDHDHSKENTISAFDKLWPRVSSGGILAFHDYRHPAFEGGTEAIQKLCREHRLEPHIIADSFIAFRKP